MSSLTRTAIMSRAMTLPRRKPASKRPATMSVRPTSTEISMVISGEEARQYRCQREFCHRRREGEAQMAGGPVAERVDRFDRRIEPVEQRAQLAQHALARLEARTREAAARQ